MHKYEVGDVVRIVPRRVENFNNIGEMDEWLDQEMNIGSCYAHERLGDVYRMVEDGGCWVWTDSMIVGLTSSLDTQALFNPASSNELLSLYDCEV
jgi:hypothetical protein